MTAILIFIVLPVLLIVAAFFIKPLVQRDKRYGDPRGEGLAARGIFGGHELLPDERVVAEETERVKFDFGEPKEAG
ncbi:hypothetical protein E7T06_12850 [Deinococcus sp. Arct2-2]|uniref:hypothetical protein n=1 Tax=Deinococcus sp. Arct2-2 TaxID=2568653 RepID=UPI0010A3CEE7|nr:hypothetical protein [Deinococcus sp. Arct2-2]THF69264.1 hypothetical protein E7T06_12850 [Deinococcus sp. Arct2-2]